MTRREKLQAGTTVEFGDCSAYIPELLARLEAKSVFLVVDRAAYEHSGAEQKLTHSWEDREVVEFEITTRFPRMEEVQEGLKTFRQYPCEVVIAVGGGTAIDTAKLIRCISGQVCKPDEIFIDSNRIKETATPLIAVPTTAGTGSEITQFAVVYSGGVKHSVAHPSITPNTAVIDWELTQSLSPQITAETGLDALCQSIESIWSIHSTDESVSCAVEALQLTWKYLREAVLTPTPESRIAMSRAAHLAGKAIDISKTTAPHAISYKITHDFGIAHGHAAALTLGPTMVFNSSTKQNELVDERGLEHLHDALQLILTQLGAHDAREGMDQIDKLMRSIGCSTRLSSLGIEGTEVLSRIAESVNQERLGNNPRRMDCSQVLQILESIR